MNVGRAGVAIVQMLRLPRPRTPPRWLALIPPAYLFAWLGRLWSWLALAVTLGVTLGLVPLFGVLGYELALAAAVFAAVMGLDVGSGLAREMQRLPVRAGYPARTVAGGMGAAALLAIAVAVIPAVICALRGIWVPTCDWWFGIVAYAAMPLMTAALAAALGFAIGIVAPWRWLGAALAQLPLILLAVGWLWRFVGEPPVFGYSPIVGYFPGNLYDEHIRLGAPVLWSRLEQVLWIVAIGAVLACRLDVPRLRVVRDPRPVGHRLGAIVLALACAAGATALHASGGTLGYAIDASDIQDELAGRIETAHFVIHYARTPEIDKEIGLIAEDHELRYAEVVAQLGVAPAGKLTSYYFADRDQKARWFGARDVEMAKPWRHEIYLDHRAFPHSSLRHEIAHAVASAFGDPIFGVAARRVLGVPVLFSPGLIEGLAVAVDWPGGEYGRLTPHEAVRALEAMGLSPTIGELLSLRFLTVSSARSYTTAGSFMRFLLDRYGAVKFRALYETGGDFAGTYDKSLAELEAEWRTMIGEIVLPGDVIEGTRERFRTGSVFSRPCPHAIAARRDAAVTARANGERTRAIALMRHVCDDAPEEPRNRLDLGDFLIAGDERDRSEAHTLWTALADDERITSSVRAQALEKLARDAAARHDLAATTALIERARTLPVDSEERRQLDAEAFSLHHEGPAGAALRGYFFAPGGALDGPSWALLATLAEPDLGFGHYLLGLQKAGEWKVAAAELELALARGVPGLAFVRNGARKLAVAAYRAGDLAGVGQAITALSAPDMTQTDLLLADDWSKRLVFDATGHL